MEHMYRYPGEPYTYTDGTNWFWKRPGAPTHNGPFVTHNDALDDIVADNSARADRIIARARICHEVKRAWCVYNGDHSQPAWDDAPPWQRSSAINGVVFHMKNPNAGDSASHDSWLAEKVTGGWVYGEVKDPEAKRHPCIVAFDQLDPVQQFKDRLFRTIVHAATV